MTGNRLDVRALRLEMWDALTIPQLRAIGLRIRDEYARTPAQTSANAKELEQLRRDYRVRLAILERSDPRARTTE